MAGILGRTSTKLVNQHADGRAAAARRARRIRGPDPEDAWNRGQGMLSDYNGRVNPSDNSLPVLIGAKNQGHDDDWSVGLSQLRQLHARAG
jgi:hypothetical protein